jgi:hypothetical protein
MIALESVRCIGQTRFVLLDRLLHGAELSPLSICDIRHGVRVENAGSDETQLHFVLRGEGALRAGPDFTATVETPTLVIVPPGIAHAFEPWGGSTRVISLQPISTSARLPTVIAGDGESGLLLACARLRSNGHDQFPFALLQKPIVTALAQAPWAAAAFAALRAEQENAWPGRRCMTALLMHQCFVHTLRQQPELWEQGEKHEPSGRTSLA